MKYSESAEFNERIWKTIAEIPYGRVMSYGKVAQAAGFPGLARRVGQAMHRAPESLGLPWHRVINSSGKIAFAIGSDQYNLQRAKLESEGIEFNKECIDMQQFMYQPSLDEILWKP